MVSALRVRAGGVEVQQDGAVHQKDGVEAPLRLQTPSPLKASQQDGQQQEEGGSVEEEEQSDVGGGAGETLTPCCGQHVNLLEFASLD